MLNNPDDADALAADRVLHKIGPRVDKLTGEVTEVEVHFASDLSATVNNLIANLEKVIAQLRGIVATAPPEKKARYQAALDAVVRIHGNEGGKLERIISAGGLISKPNKEAAILLLEASKKFLRNVDFDDDIRQLDKDGKEIGG